LIKQETRLSATTVTVQTLHDFTAAWNRHEIDALMGFMSDDCEFHAVAGPDVMGRSFIGRAAVREGFQMAWQNFPDASWTEGARLLREVFGYDTHMLSRGEVAERYVKDADCQGAMHESEGIGVHPLKLAHGYLRAARALGVEVHPASPVLGVQTLDGVHHLRTPGGTVRARAVGLCTGGYTSNGLHPSLDNKIMPILSNCLVTRPLTDCELAATGFETTQVITDTRTLRNYYRRLPDKRVQIGSRSAITGADAQNPKHMKRLVDALHRKFPALTGTFVPFRRFGQRFLYRWYCLRDEVI
jgi:glycine/D-amino acid oxidase-like deaminating enzyme